MYDLIIKGGTILDGTGSEGYKADIAIDGETIAAIGEIPAEAADSEINVDGKMVELVPDNFRKIVPKGGLKGYESH